MDRVLNALFTEDKGSDDLRLTYYMLNKEVGHIEEKTVELFVKNVKSLLLSSKTRCQGLVVLSHLLPELNNDIFTNNCSNLLQPTIKVLQESTNSEERVLAFKVLTQIFAKIYRMDSPNFTRELSNCMSLFLMNCFADIKLSEVYYAAHCLGACATMFSSVVSSKRAFLENKIIEAISTVVDADGDVDTLKALGFCYSKVVLSGSSTLLKYREFFSKLMNTLRLFLNLYNVFSISKPGVVFNFENDQIVPNVYKEISDIFVDPVKNVRRLYFLTAAICSMMTGQHSTAVPLPVEAILECLSQFMLISNGNIKESHSIDVYAIGHVLPVLYENIFYILKALLSSCKQNLIIFTRLINRIVISSLEWLDKVNSVQKLLYLRVRCTIYSFVALYFSTLGVKSSLSSVEIQLVIKHLLANIKIAESNITFASNINHKVSLNLSIVQKDSLIKSTLDSIRALNCILKTMSSTLDISAYVLIQNEVIYTLLHIYRNWFNLASPYKNEQCRHELITLLKTLLVDAPVNYSPPLETAIVIFTQAHRLEKSPYVHSLVENCFHLVDFIMDSRIFSHSATTIPNVIYSSEPTCVVAVGISRQDQTVMNDSSSFKSEQKFQTINIATEFKPQTSDNTNMPHDRNKDNDIFEVSSTELNTVAQGNKRKYSDSNQHVKIAKAGNKLPAEDFDKDVIFEGIFNKPAEDIAKPIESNIAINQMTNLTNESTDSTSTNITISNESNLSSSLVIPEQANKSEEQTSAEADDALNYFVVD